MRSNPCMTYSPEKRSLDVRIESLDNHFTSLRSKTPLPANARDKSARIPVLHRSGFCLNTRFFLSDYRPENSVKRSEWES